MVNLALIGPEEPKIRTRLIEPVRVCDIFVTGLSHIENLPDGIKRLVFYCDETVYEYDGDGTKVIATVMCKILITEEALANLISTVNTSKNSNT